MTAPVQLPPRSNPFDPNESPIGIVAGSGILLTPLLDETLKIVAFDDIPQLPKGSVQGHPRQFICGRHQRVPIVLQSGRLHPYEGLAFADVVRTVDVLHAFGVQKILFTSAVGGIEPQLQPGHLVGAETIATWPYPEYDLPKTITPDFVIKGCDSVGVFQWMHGPCYETRAEINALRQLNRCTVGMSSAPEMLHCATLGIHAGLVSCVTNVFGGDHPLTHDDVLTAAARSSTRLCDLIHTFLAESNNDHS